jgi:hypothetical protein
MGHLTKGDAGRFVGNFSSFVTGNMQESISEFRRTLDQLA